MATGTEAYDASVGGTGIPGWGGANITKIVKRMDAADIIAADATLAAAGKIAAGQEITAVELPVGFNILGVAAKIVEVCTDATHTANIGTYADTTAFDAAIDIGAAVGTLTYTGTDAGGAAALNGTMITSTASNANKVCVEYIADTTNGAFDLMVWGVDLRFPSQM